MITKEYVIYHLAHFVVIAIVGAVVWFDNKKK